jgi:hypothetical protein
MTRLFALLVVMGLAACKPDAGERCNPLAFTDDCQPNNQSLSCVYPTAPNCGVAYCCAVDSQGNVVDKHPSCQPDPDALAACMLDLAPPDDGGTTD